MISYIEDCSGVKIKNKFGFEGFFNKRLFLFGDDVAEVVIADLMAFLFISESEAIDLYKEMQRYFYD